MLHGPEADQSTRPTQTGFAVDGNGPVIRLCEMVFHNLEELVDNLLWRIGAIDEEKIVV